jgi:hypothetical protein
LGYTRQLSCIDRARTERLKKCLNTLDTSADQHSSVEIYDSSSELFTTYAVYLHGLSRALSQNIPDAWEKITIYIMVPALSDMWFFNIGDAQIARYNESAEPPSARYEEMKDENTPNLDVFQTKFVNVVRSCMSSDEYIK